jgi:hypothetical protein
MTRVGQDQSCSNWERRKMSEIMERNKEAKLAAIRLRRELKDLQVIISAVPRMCC